MRLVLLLAVLPVVFGSELQQEPGLEGPAPLPFSVGSSGSEADLERRRHRKCGGWGKWETSECLWPGAKVKLPDSCKSKIMEKMKKKLPAWFLEFIKAKIEEKIEMVEGRFTKRGATQPCGHCSRKLRCRSHIQKPGKKYPPFCYRPERQFVREECPGTEVCRLTLVNGGCPPPLPHFRRHRRRHHHRRPHPHRPSEEEEEEDEDDNFMEGGLDFDLERGGRHWNATHPPSWHCVRNKAKDKCLCCCGGFFPDLATETCKNIHGSKPPPPEFSEDLEDLALF